MFTIYKKVISPETSPVLGPANATPPNITPKEDTQTSETSATSATSYLANMEPFSLCNYCCSARPKQDLLPPTPDPMPKPDQAQSLEYEFGHATHYKYNATTPRFICEFDFKLNS